MERLPHAGFDISIVNGRMTAPAGLHPDISNRIAEIKVAAFLVFLCRTVAERNEAGSKKKQGY
jgi:hypothetical protein